MNLELLESFGQNYPEEFDGSLDCISMAVTCSFNRCPTEILVPRRSTFLFKDLEPCLLWVATMGAS